MTVAARENLFMRDTNENFELTGIRHGFFTRLGGVSEGLYASLNCGLGSNDKRENVLENRRRVAEEMGTEPQRLLTLYQTHSADTKTVTGPWHEKPPEADAMATRTPGLALGILAADCAPVLFADAENNVIGAAHAGWRARSAAFSNRRLRPWKRLAHTVLQSMPSSAPRFRKKPMRLDRNSSCVSMRRTATTPAFLVPQGIRATPISTCPPMSANGFFLQASTALPIAPRARMSIRNGISATAAPFT